MSDPFQSEDQVDRWCAENLPIPAAGIYVDVGCAHPVKYSNTAWLRERGWFGLVIDGDPAYLKEWIGVPKTIFENHVVSSEREVMFLVEPTNALVSRVHPEGKPRVARTLSNLVAMHYGFDPIHFMSVDIEGCEFDVIREFANRRPHAMPQILVAEYDSCHKGRDYRLFNFLPHVGMELVHLTPMNAVFVSK